MAVYNQFKSSDRKFLLYFALLLLYLLCFNLDNNMAQNPLKKRINLNVNNKSLEEVILHIQNTGGIAFSYSKNIIRLDKRVSANYIDTPIDEVLDRILGEADIIYIVKAGMLVLQPKPQNIDKLILTGTVKSMENELPMEYAGIRLKGSGKGAITDRNGNFSFQVKRSELNDSIEVSSLGYEKASYLASGFTEDANHVVYLKLNVVELQTVQIKASDFRIRSLGNHGIFSFGSIYIDTQGQQTALFIENKREKKGYIKSVSYYLSSKGNVQSPFRVRIYAKDSISGKPGKDLLNEMLIAKPKDEGWFKMEVSQFNIEVPGDGFFVAIEGMYPNEMFRNQYDNSESLNDEFPNTISYGQCLGYSKKRGENTWHYSLAHTWFQLKENNFHVMISAEIQHRKKNRK